MKIKKSICKTQYHYSGNDKYGDARKTYYGWNSTDCQSSEDKETDIVSARDFLNEIIETADANGYEVEDFRICLNKICSKKLRKSVTFKCEVLHR